MAIALAPAPAPAPALRLGVLARLLQGSRTVYDFRLPKGVRHGNEDQSLAVNLGTTKLWFTAKNSVSPHGRHFCPPCCHGKGRSSGLSAASE